MSREPKKKVGFSLPKSVILAPGGRGCFTPWTTWTLETVALETVEFGKSPLRIL